MRLTKLKDREALKRWQEFSNSFSTPVDDSLNENDTEKHKRIKRLLGNFEEFSYYYFPRITKAKFAKWHKKFTKYLIEVNYDLNIAVIKVARDMAKSSVTALLIVFLYFNGEFKSLAMFSYNEYQAIDLLAPVKIALEQNERLIADFGNRRGVSGWSDKKFTTIDGVKFAAFGAGQSPRGGKTVDSDRFDFEIFDDFDHPEVCENPARLDKNWKYVLGDCFPAMHVSGKKRVLFLNNKIAEDCIIERMWKHAKANFKGSALCITVNLIDSEGRSNWPEAYTDKQCQEMIILAEDEADTEYLNDPKAKGTEFKKEWMQFKKLPPLSRYKILIAYLDGGFKKTKTSDTKALVLVGFMEGEYHIHKAYVDNTSIGGMIAWHYDLWNYLKQKNATAVWFMEEVFLLGLLHDHFDDAIKEYGFRIPMIGDKRKKPDKDLRIGNIAGYFERGKVWFDKSLEEDRYTKRLIKQFTNFKKGVRNNEKDGPDATEGAICLINEQVSNITGGVETGRRHKSKHKL